MNYLKESMYKYFATHLPNFAEENGYDRPMTSAEYAEMEDTMLKIFKETKDFQLYEVELRNKQLNFIQKYRCDIDNFKVNNSGIILKDGTLLKVSNFQHRLVLTEMEDLMMIPEASFENQDLRDKEEKLIFISSGNLYGWTLYDIYIQMERNTLEISEYRGVLETLVRLLVENKVDTMNYVSAIKKEELILKIINILNG